MKCRHEARDIIRNAVRASEHDRVLFEGSGATGAIHRLIHALNFTSPPVVLVCPYSHHSSLLPWKELGATVVRIKQSSDGTICMRYLEETLQKYEKCNGDLIGCFTKASNVSGILLDDIAITKLLHKYNALSFWDYATAGKFFVFKY